MLHKNCAQRERLRSLGIRIPSARPTLLRMKLMIIVLRFTIRPHVNPEKPKLGFALMTMLANVRRNCVKTGVTRRQNPCASKKKCPIRVRLCNRRRGYFGEETSNLELQPVLETKTGTAVALTREFWIEGVCLILCVDCIKRANELIFQMVSKLNSEW